MIFFNREKKELKSRLAERGKEIEKIYAAIGKIIVALNQTERIFKSKRITQIRWELIDILPIEKQMKFIGIQPSEPWPTK